MLVVPKFFSVSDVPEMPRVFGFEKTRYDIHKDGKPYGVYGMMFIKNRVDYLVCRTEDSPTFIPSWLFEILDPVLPSGWKACNVVYDDIYSALYRNFGISYMVGYGELVENIEHYRGLLERDHAEARVFFRMKNEIDLNLYGKII